jgi:mono/diheme cytochrome c family protein
MSANRPRRHGVYWRAVACAVVATAGAFAAHAQLASGTAHVSIVTHSGTQVYDANQLLDNARLAEVPLAGDPFYGKVARTYLAVPMTALIDPETLHPDQNIEFRSTDGFVATMPARALLNRAPSQPRAWLAIEPPIARWPVLPAGGNATPGPFALIWSGPGADRVWTERWPYQVAQVSLAPSPLDRWPQLKVDDATGSLVRQGQQVFIAQCFVCHQFAGAGVARVGPDLNKPMSPTQYFQPAALEKYIRDPASVRDWPGRRMEAFPVERLSDGDLKALIAFLAHKTAPAPD